MTKSYGMKILMNMFGRAMVNLLISVYLSRLECVITDKDHVVLIFVTVQQCNQITHCCISCLQILSKICTVPEQLLWTS
jgi:hypothetical protein